MCATNPAAAPARTALQRAARRGGGLQIPGLTYQAAGLGWLSTRYAWRESLRATENAPGADPLGLATVALAVGVLNAAICWRDMRVLQERRRAREREERSEGRVRRDVKAVLESIIGKLERRGAKELRLQAALEGLWRAVWNARDTAGATHATTRPLSLNFRELPSRKTCVLVLAPKASVVCARIL